MIRGCPFNCFSYRFIKFSFSKVSRPESGPDSTQLADPNRSPVYSDIFNYLLKTFCLCYFILDFLITRKHFILGKPINIYKFKRLITFTFNKMHLQNRSSEFKLFYKISMFERNGVNAYDGAYSANLSL